MEGWTGKGGQGRVDRTWMTGQGRGQDWEESKGIEERQGRDDRAGRTKPRGQGREEEDRAGKGQGRAGQGREDRIRSRQGRAGQGREDRTWQGREDMEDSAVRTRQGRQGGHNKEEDRTERTGLGG